MEPNPQENIQKIKDFNNKQKKNYENGTQIFTHREHVIQEQIEERKDLIKKQLILRKCFFFRTKKN